MQGGAYDFVLMGPAGFIGAAILKHLDSAGYRTLATRMRLQDRMGFEKLLDENPPKIGVICAAGERGRPNISWCDSHPVETLDANITCQFGIAAACKSRGLHCVLIGTAIIYEPWPDNPGYRFKEEDPPNVKDPGVYTALRIKQEELLKYFDNVLTLRVLYPVSNDLDQRGLIGKLARFKRVDKVKTSVTIFESLCPLIPELCKRGATGVLNFAASGTVSYVDIIEELAKRAPPGWKPPPFSEGAGRAAPELDVAKLAAASGRPVPDATETVRRIIQTMPEAELAQLLRSAL